MRGRLAPDARRSPLEEPDMLRSLPLLLIYSLLTAGPVAAVLASRVEARPQVAQSAAVVPTDRMAVQCKAGLRAAKPG